MTVNDKNSMKKIVLALYLFSMSAKPVDFSDLLYTTEEYPPFTYQVNNKVSGFSVDLLSLVWLQLGVKAQPITLLPWARAYHDALHQNDRVLFGVAKTVPREGQFQWACPIISTEYVLLTKRSKTFDNLQVKDLSAYQIGTIRSDVGEQILLGMLDNQMNISSNVSLKSNLELLDKGRIDLFVYDKDSASMMISQLGYDPADYRDVFHIADALTCFAFSRQVDPVLVEKFQQALKLVVASQAYGELQKKYLPWYQPK